MAITLFSDDFPAYDGELPIGSNSLRHRVAKLNPEFLYLLRPFVSNRDANLTATANLFDDVEISLSLQYDRSGAGYKVFSGLAGTIPDSKAVLTADERIFTLNISTNDQEYQVNPLEESVYLIEELSLIAVDDCEPHSHNDHSISRESYNREIGREPPQSDFISVKVLILFTAAVREALNGDIGTVGYIRHMVENANQSFKDSKTGVILSYDAKECQLDGMPAGYCDTADFLRNSKQVSTWRHESSADLVSILKIDEGRSCAHCLGSIDGNISSAFSAVNLKQAKQQHSFTHEIGHNFGCGHDFEEKGCAEASARGNRFIAGGKERGTLMAYGANRVPLFSALDVNFLNVPTGCPTRDNAQTIRKTAPKIARYHEGLGAAL